MMHLVMINIIFLFICIFEHVGDEQVQRIQLKFPILVALLRYISPVQLCCYALLHVCTVLCNYIT